MEWGEFMSITKHPEEFEKQVVREVPEKARTIDSTMTSCDLVPQIVKACSKYETR